MKLNEIFTQHIDEGRMVRDKNGPILTKAQLARAADKAANTPRFNRHGEIEGKAAWKEAITAVGAVKFTAKHPDILAFDAKGTEIGWYDGTDNTGYSTPTVKKMSTHDIHWKVTELIGSSFPDGDPIDSIGPWMKKNDVSMDEINAAFDKEERRFFKDGMYGYLSSKWDDMADDAVCDANASAKSGERFDMNSNFYTVDKKDKKITKRNNPWK